MPLSISCHRGSKLTVSDKISEIISAVCAALAWGLEMILAKVVPCCSQYLARSRAWVRPFALSSYSARPWYTPWAFPVELSVPEQGYAVGKFIFAAGHDAGVKPNPWHHAGTFFQPWISSRLAVSSSKIMIPSPVITAGCSSMIRCSPGTRLSFAALDLLSAIRAA